MPHQSWPRRMRQSHVAVFAGIIVLIVPIILAAATPRLAQVRASSIASVPSAPETAAGAPATLDGVADDLPIFVRGLPGASSEAAAARYDAATLFAPQSIADAFTVSWEGLVVAPPAEATIRDLGLCLAWKGGFDASCDLAALSTRGIEALRSDPANADRANNAAVALFALGVSANVSPPFETLDVLGETLAWARDDETVFKPSVLQRNAIHLLDSVRTAFPDVRAAAVNHAFLTSVQSGLVRVEALTAAVESAGRALAANPADTTARWLYGNLVARSITANNAQIDAAVAVLAPLIAEPATAALGHAAMGDAYMAAATFESGSAPFLARSHARRALEEYDAALAANGDPGLWAGRAAALNFLGERKAAIEAQQRAIATAPASAELWLSLAMLQRDNGAYADMHTSAERVAALQSERDPTIREVRYLRSFIGDGLFDPTPGDRGFGGFSYLSDRARGANSVSPQGGGQVVRLNLIPRSNDAGIDDRLRSGPMAIVAPQLVADSVLLQGTPQTTVEKALQDADPAVALDRAENVYRNANRFEDAAELCRLVAARPPIEGFPTVRARQCRGESEYLAGNYGSAYTLLDAVLTVIEKRRPLTTQGMLDGNIEIADLRLRVAAAAEAATQRDTARRLFGQVAADMAPGEQIDASQPPDAATVSRLARLLKEQVAANVDTDPIGTIASGLRAAEAWRALGDIALDEGRLADAAAYFGVPLALVDALGLAPVEQEVDTYLDARLLTADAQNNRGIARIRLAQTVPEAPPNCDGDARAVCDAADADFGAALAIDPRNPVFLLNRGWSRRLVGDASGAITALDAAIVEDPSLFPGLNDLGVLRAEAGDREGAVTAFEAGLAAEPGYDLTAWNLGVLEMEGGPADVLPGQAHLARAIEASPGFRSDNLGLKTDERVYRVRFGVQPTVSTTWAFGRSYSLAATGLAGIGVIAGVLAVWAQMSAGTVSGWLGLCWHRSWARAGEWLARISPIPRGLTNFLLGADPTSAWIVTVLALLGATVWSVWRIAPSAVFNTTLIALFAVSLAVIAHEIGHALARRRRKAMLIHASWAPGVPLALAMVPLNLSAGPFVGHEVSADDGGIVVRVVMAGPLANVAYAALAYGLFVWQPMPMFRVIAAVQLAAAAYTLLPFPSLDGRALRAQSPKLLSALSLWIGVASALLAAGVL